MHPDYNDLTQVSSYGPWIAMTVVMRPSSASPVVLIVDDDPSIRSLAALIVAGGGYGVLTAAGGPEALRITSQAHVDLLLTDFTMPGMNGAELIERVRSLGTTERFLVMSGTERASCEAGAPVLSKPFAANELLRKIEDVIAS